MKILVPVSLYVPSGCSIAFVFIRRRSVPQPGSVRHIVPAHSPEIIFGSTNCFIQSAPVAPSAPAAAPVSPGYIAKDWLDDDAISATASVMSVGSPAPPNFVGAESEPHPASQ